MASNNHLTGTNPEQLAFIPALESLQFASNAISGSLPTELGAASKLSLLDFQKNQLSGSIPTELGLLDELTFLDLSENDLQGTVPADVAELPFLAQFNVAGNLQLSGTFTAGTCNPDRVSSSSLIALPPSVDVAASVVYDLKASHFNLGCQKSRTDLICELPLMTRDTVEENNNDYRARLGGILPRVHQPLPEWLQQTEKSLQYGNFSSRRIAKLASALVTEEASTKKSMAHAISGLISCR